MKKFIVRRVLLGAMILFFVSMIIYSIERALPTSYVEGRARDMSMKQGAKPYDELVAELNAAYGLDKPVYVQLFMYLKNILHGDFGVSLKMQKNRAVLDIIVDMFPVSAKVGALALAWAILVGVPLGCLAAFKRGKLTDSILRVICTLGISKLRCGICSSGNPDWKQCTESVSVYF